MKGKNLLLKEQILLGANSFLLGLISTEKGGNYSRVACPVSIPIHLNT